jgi:hypothetical protein
VARGGSGETIRILFEPGLEFHLGWRASGRHVLGEESHLLRETTLYDRVVPVETQRHRFSVKHFLSDTLPHESGQFLGTGLPFPLRGEGYLELPEIIDRQLDSPGTRCLSRIRTHRSVNGEQEAADHDEMYQRFAEPTSQS